MFAWDTIIASVIEVGGLIIAAIIGVNGFKKIIAPKMSSDFFCYNENSENLQELLFKATEDVTFVVIYGDELLTTYKDSIISCLKRGVNVRFLLCNAATAIKYDKMYFMEKASTTRSAENILKSLKVLKQLQKYKGFEVRTTDKTMTASYICIDSIKKTVNPPKSAVIHMMLYQYKTDTKFCPITYLYPKNNAEIFKTTAKSVENLWYDSENTDIGSYEKEVRAILYSLSQRK